MSIMVTSLPTTGSPVWRVRLAAALDESGKSKREVSIAAGLGPNYIREILKDGKEPSVGNLMAIAAALNVSVSGLCGENTPHTATVAS